MDLKGCQNFAQILNKAEALSEQSSNNGEVRGEESVIMGQSAQVMSGTQGPPRPPVIIHTLALHYSSLLSDKHNNSSPPPIC